MTTLADVLSLAQDMIDDGIPEGPAIKALVAVAEAAGIVVDLGPVYDDSRDQWVFDREPDPHPDLHALSKAVDELQRMLK